MTRIWLVRHGTTTAPPGVAIGSTDVPLSELGERQARRAAEQLADRPLAAVLSSDLRRARRTAELVAAPHGLAVEILQELRELDFGPWEARDLAGLWIEARAEAEAWAADIRRTPSQFRESIADLEARVGRVAPRLRAGASGEIAVVAHRGSLAMLHALLSGTAFADAWALPLDHGCVIPLAAAGPC